MNGLCTTPLASHTLLIRSTWSIFDLVSWSHTEMIRTTKPVFSSGWLIIDQPKSSFTLSTWFKSLKTSGSVSGNRSKNETFSSEVRLALASLHLCFYRYSLTLLAKPCTHTSHWIRHCSNSRWRPCVYCLYASLYKEAQHQSRLQERRTNYGGYWCQGKSLKASESKNYSRVSTETTKSQSVTIFSTSQANSAVLTNEATESSSETSETNSSPMTQADQNFHSAWS